MRAATWWIDRWRQSSAYMDMTLAEQGAYRNLLDDLWLREGPIPDDERVLGKACGDRVEWPVVRDAVLAKFTLTEDGWIQSTQEKVALKAQAFRESQAEKGRKGAAVRWKDKPPKDSPANGPAIAPDVTEGMASGLRSQYSGNSAQESEKDGTDKSRSASPKPDKFAESISTVVAHFRELHPRARPGKSDKGKIRARLVDGYSAEDLCASIDGMHKTPHNLGQNDRGEKFLTLNLAMREKNVPRFIETNSDQNNGNPSLSKNEQKFKRTVQNLRKVFGDDRQEGVSDGDGRDGSGSRPRSERGEDCRLLESPEREDGR